MTKRFPLLLFLALLLLSGCGGTTPPTEASVGDTWTRPADRMVMLYLPPGEFRMGSDGEDLDAATALCETYRGECDRALFEDEQPVHTVVLNGFWIDRTEVTNRQYRRCVEGGGCEEPGCWDEELFSLPEQPVVCVTWQQAQDYCAWAGGRLPTEAEWEFAARGPEGWIYPWGDTFDGTRLNYCDINCTYSWSDAAVDDGYAVTAPVGSFPQGESWCGALDLAGNVWEWVADWYGEYPSERQVNPSGAPTGVRRVLRGGSWDLDPAYVRATVRNWGFPERFSRVSGFRCAYSSPPLSLTVEQ